MRRFPQNNGLPVVMSGLFLGVEAGARLPRGDGPLSPPAQNMWRRMLMFTSSPMLSITLTSEEPP